MTIAAFSLQKASVEHCPDTMVFDGGIGACTPEATCARAASASLRTSVPTSQSSSSLASSYPASAALEAASTLVPQVSSVGSVETDLEGEDVFCLPVILSARLLPAMSWIDNCCFKFTCRN